MSRIILNYLVVRKRLTEIIVRHRKKEMNMLSGLVPFDQMGVFGPAMTLLYNSSKLNDVGLSEVAESLKKNFKKLARFSPKGKKEFCRVVRARSHENNPLSPTEIIATRFFQNMRKEGVSEEVQQLAKNLIVPIWFKAHPVSSLFPISSEQSEDSEKIHEWLGRLVTCYMSEEQMNSLLAQQKQPEGEEKCFQKRTKIGSELYKSMMQKEFTRKDFTVFKQVIKQALEELANTDHPSQVLRITGKYLSLFSLKQEDPKSFGDEIMNKMDLLKNKAFPDL